MYFDFFGKYTIFVFGFFIAFILKNEIIVRIVFIVLGVFLMKKSAGKNQFGPIPKK